MSTAAPWSDSVGEAPFRVVAFENATRGGQLYLRWWVPDRGNWTVQSLRRSLRDEAGRPLKGKARKELIAWALGEAEAKRSALIAAASAAGVAEASEAAAADRPLTLGETEARITDRDTGKYRTPSRHRGEVLDALAFAVRIWGAATPWAALRRRDIRTLWRRRLDELRGRTRPDGTPVDGFRSTEKTIQCINAIATWLRDEELIPEHAAIAPQHWKQELKADWSELSGEAEPRPKQPRHTPDEYRRIMAKTAEVEPRMGLLLELGAELRLGQVARAKRSALELDAGTHGIFRSPGRGKKRGPIVDLTADQRTAVDRALAGYLVELEAAYQAGTLADYPLFPGGLLARVVVPGPDGKKVKQLRATVARHAAAEPTAEPVERRWIGVAFKEVEASAGVEHIPGRGPYGMRRVAVDLALDENISSRALQEHGGWADEQMPNRVYRDRENAAGRQEAAQVRARIRGRTAAAPSSTPTTTPDAATTATDAATTATTGGATDGGAA